MQSKTKIFLITGAAIMLVVALVLAAFVFIKANPTAIKGNPKVNSSQSDCAAIKSGSSSADENKTLKIQKGVCKPSTLEEYANQDIIYKDCGDTICFDLKVPLDYNDLSKGPRMIPVAIKDDLKNIGTKPYLFVNPGGPGGDAISFLDSGFDDSTLKDKYSIAAIQPRGVGTKLGIECLDDRALNAYIDLDPTPDTPAEIDAMLKANKSISAACIKKTGDFAKHISTEESVKDMDLVREVLKQKKFNFIGYSYGTQLAATYITMFPKNVGHIAMDAAVDPLESSTEIAYSQAVGFNKSLNEYFATCNDRSTCPFRGLTQEQATNKVNTFLNGLDKSPLKASGPQKLTESRAFYGIILPLYVEGAEVLLDKGFAEAFDGDGSGLITNGNLYFDQNEDGTFNDNSLEAQIGIACLDNGENHSVEEIKKELPRFEKAAPVLGRTTLWSIVGCNDWPRDYDNTQKAVTAKDLDTKVLIISATGDPATPYASGVALQKELGDNSILITRVGFGHGSYHNAHKPCIDNAVDDYFLKDVIPAIGIRC